MIEFPGSQSKEPTGAALVYQKFHGHSVLEFRIERNVLYSNGCDYPLDLVNSPRTSTAFMPRTSTAGSEASAQDKK
jgi:hypothetical protein